MALVLIGSIAAITDAVAASLVSGATATRTAVDQRVRILAEDMVGETISNNPAVTQAVIDTINNTPGMVGQLAWGKSQLGNFTNLDNLTTPGVYPIANASSANSLVGWPSRWVTAGPAMIEVKPGSTTNNTRTQTITTTPAYGTRRVEVTRHQDANGVWSEWSRVDQGFQPIPTGDNIDDYRTDWHSGLWRWSNQAGLTGNLPFGDYPFTMQVFIGNGAAWQVAYPGGESSYASPKLRKYSPLGTVGWGAWREQFPTSQAGVGEQRQVVLANARTRHGGKIGTAGKAVVAISFDHGFTALRDNLLPVLRDLGLPVTVAVNTATLNTGESDGITLSTLQGWAINEGLELANHSRSHSDATTDEAIEDMIVGALRDMRAGAPEVTIDSYIMPGVSGTAYNGFSGGSPMERWWTHAAGRYILGNHAAVTGNRDGYVTPADGSPQVGANRLTVDTTSFADVAEARIQAAIATGGVARIFAHPALMGQSEQITLARWVTLLNYVAQLRDEGKIVVMTEGAAAWADADRQTVADLAKLATWSAGNGVITLADGCVWAAGSQWLLEVPAAAPGPVTVTSDAGGLDISRTVTPRAGVARVMFTIPKSATTVTVSCGATPRIIPA